MLKLSEITVGQTLILFENVLDSERVLRSDIIQALVKGLQGVYNLSFENIKNNDEFQDWVRDEWYRNHKNAMVFPFAKFEDLAQHNHSEEFTGPLNVFIFRPKDAECYYLVLTCHWASSDGLFRNDNAVIGIIIDRDDLKRAIKKVVK